MLSDYKCNYHSVNVSSHTFPGLLVTHLCQYGVYRRFLGSTKTIPQRETVAGEAYCRSPTCDGEHTLYYELYAALQKSAGKDILLTTILKKFRQTSNSRAQ